MAGPADLASRGISIAMVLVAWAILHLSYADRYARVSLHAAEPPLEFPGTPSDRRGLTARTSRSPRERRAIP